METTMNHTGKKRCAACGKPAATELCDGCGKAFNRIYGTTKDQDQERAMATKKTATKGSKSNRKQGTSAPPLTPEQEAKVRSDVGAALGEASTAPAPAAQEPAATPPATEPPPPAEEPEADESEDEEPEADESAPEGGEDAAPEGGEAAKKSARYAWLKRVNALRTLRTATRFLEKYDYSQWGVTGVAASLALLKNAAEQLQKMKKNNGGKAAIVVDAKVRIVAKHRADYEGILEPEDMSGLVVKTLRKGTCACVTPDGERIILPTSRLEVDG